MGRIKDQLGEAPPTIGDAKRLGAAALLVTCNAMPAAGQAFDRRRLPDDTPFIEIATLCRTALVPGRDRLGRTAMRPLDPLCRGSPCS